MFHVRWTALSSTELWYLLVKAVDMREVKLGFYI